MSRSTTIAGAGAIAGVLVAIVATAMSAGAIIDGGAGFTPVDPVTGSGRGTMTAGTDAMYLYVLGFGTIGGALIGYITTAVARSWRPTEPRSRPGRIALLGAVVGAIAAYAVLRVGVGIGGSITDEVVTISAFRGIITFIAAGAVAGSVVAVTAERYSKPAALALEGEAWPKSKRAFMGKSLPAMGIPALAIVLIGATVFGVSRVLLIEGLSTAFPIVVASLVAAGVLGGAAYLARPKDQQPTD